MKAVIIFIALILLLGLQYCNSSNEEKNNSNSISNMSDAYFLVGEWRNEQKDGFITEKWIKIDDSTMHGVSCFIQQGDTASYEEILLMKRNNEMFYIPSVNNQNQGKPVVFTRVFGQEDRLVFENKEHDFPQRIIYFRISSDSIMAEISGEIRGKKKFINFPMKKHKEE